MLFIATGDKNDDNLYNERKTYHSTDKVAEFDTSRFEITYQRWEGDSIVHIKDYFAGKVLHVKKYFQDCKLIKTEYFDKEGNIVAVYENEYKDFDLHGNWLFQEIYKTEEGERVN